MPPKHEDTSIVYVDKRLEGIIPQFLKAQRADIDRMKIALSTEDQKEIMRLGHRMRGSCGSYQFQILASFAEEIEKAASRSDFTTVKSALEKMEAHFLSMKIEFRNI